MKKSFKNLSRIALGATLISSALMGSTLSADASQITTPVNTDSELNLNVLNTQFIEVDEKPIIDGPQERAHFLVLSTPITSGGNGWLHPNTHPYLRFNIENHENQPMTVHIIEDGINAYLGVIPAKTSKTWTTGPLRLPAAGKWFSLDYETGNGRVSGYLAVRASTSPL